MLKNISSQVPSFLLISIFSFCPFIDANVMASPKATTPIVSISRVFTDGELEKSLVNKKIVLGEWYGFEFFQDKELKLYPRSKIDVNFKSTGGFAVGQVQFVGDQNNLKQVNFKSIENSHCLNEERFEVIKSFLHVKVAASKLRSSSIVALFNQKLTCKNL